MVFTWSTKDLCIIFRQWHITGPLSFFLSLVLIVLLTAGYEGIRQVTRKYEVAHKQHLNAFAAASTTGGRSKESFRDMATTFAGVAHVPYDVTMAEVWVLKNK